MNILFISLDDYCSFSERGTYTDVLRELIKRGNNIVAISPTNDKNYSGFFTFGSSTIIKPLCISSQKVGFIKKGLSIFLIPRAIKKAIKLLLKSDKINFDLVLYATPPVTIAPVIRFLKKKFPSIKSFLMLKDIWPQVAIDVGMLSNKGIKKGLTDIIKKYEMMLYSLSDYIGCMSPGNCEYIANIYPDFQKKVLLCPNSMEPFNCYKNYSFREKLKINKEEIMLLYGGNIGVMQGIPFLCECLLIIERISNVKTIICGRGTEYKTLEKFVIENNLRNTILINGLPRDEFESLTSECDYGMVFLDWRATTPNFPSRILTYMNNSKPIIACTDLATDVGKIIQNNNFGWWIPSNDSKQFELIINKIINNNEYSTMCKNSYNYFINNYTSEKTADIILSCVLNDD